MKNIYSSATKSFRALLAAALIIAMASITNAQSVGINANGSAPDGSAMLDVSSTERGFLAPRMTAAQKAAIVLPATGLLIYQTDVTEGYYYNSGTTASPSWTQLGAASGASQWTTDGSNIYYNTGNVGIGTTVPNERLSLVQSSTSDIGVGIYNSTPYSAGNVAGGYLNLGKYEAAGPTYNPMVQLVGYPVTQGNSSEGALAIKTRKNGALTTQVTILNTGNVGIGTTAPAYKLDVAGDVNVTGNFKVNGTNIPTAAGWGLTGNAGTVDGTNFIGTTDNVALNFKANNLKAGRIDPAGSTFIGYQAGSVNTAATSTGFGYQALYSNTTGDYNAAMGNGALSANTTGGYNTASGNQSLRYNTTGVRNTASGYASLYSNTEGTYNTANGMFSLQNNTTGSNNTAIGYGSLVSNTTGSYNTASGLESLRSSTTGVNNTASGFLSLYSNTTGNNNTANGMESLKSNTTGEYNTASGRGSLYSNTTGINNTASGFYSLYSNTTSNWNTANGMFSLYSNTTGEYNTATGYHSLYSNTTGSNNTALGNNAFTSGAAFSNSTAIGNGADVTASNQVVLGNTSVTTTLLNGNVGIGTTTPAAPLTVKGSGASPIARLFSAEGFGLQYVDFGQSGADFTMNSVNLQNATLGSYIFNSTNNSTTFTRMFIDYNGNVGIGTTAPLRTFYVNGTSGGTNAWDNVSDNRLKKDVLSIENGLDKVMALRPITFNWNKTVKPELKLDDRNHLGFIAQEVEAVLPQVVSTADDAMKTKSVAYSDIVPVLTKAIQEQQALIEALQAENSSLKAENTSIKSDVEALKNAVYGSAQQK